MEGARAPCRGVPAYTRGRVWRCFEVECTWGTPPRPHPSPSRASHTQARLNVHSNVTRLHRVYTQIACSLVSNHGGVGRTTSASSGQDSPRLGRCEPPRRPSSRLRNPPLTHPGTWESMWTERRWVETGSRPAPPGASSPFPAVSARVTGRHGRAQSPQRDEQALPSTTDNLAAAAHPSPPPQIYTPGLFRGQQAPHQWAHRSVQQQTKRTLPPPPNWHQCLPTFSARMRPCRSCSRMSASLSASFFTRRSFTSAHTATAREPNAAAPTTTKGARRLAI